MFALNCANERFYVATDHLGTPRVIIDSSGIEGKTIEYDTSGRVLSDSNRAFDLQIGFAGGLVDIDTTLVHFGLRDYDPETGRWTGRDRLLYRGRQSNLYNYVYNNPVNLLDRMGGGGVLRCSTL